MNGPVYGLKAASQVAPAVKNPSTSARGIRDAGSTPGSGRPPGGGQGCPLQGSCLETLIDRGAWWATAHRVAEKQSRLRLSAHTCAHAQAHTHACAHMRACTHTHTRTRAHTHAHTRTHTHTWPKGEAEGSALPQRAYSTPPGVGDTAPASRPVVWAASPRPAGQLGFSGPAGLEPREAAFCCLPVRTLTLTCIYSGPEVFLVCCPCVLLHAASNLLRRKTG